MSNKSFDNPSKPKELQKQPLPYTLLIDDILQMDQEMLDDTLQKKQMSVSYAMNISAMSSPLGTPTKEFSLQLPVSIDQPVQLVKRPPQVYQQEEIFEKIVKHSTCTMSIDEELFGGEYDNAEHMNTPDPFCFGYTRFNQSLYKPLDLVINPCRRPVDLRNPMDTCDEEGFNSALEKIYTFSSTKNLKNNKHGYHIIVPYLFVRNWYDKNIEHATGSTTVFSVFEKNDYDEHFSSFWPALRKFVSWVSYLGGASFTENLKNKACHEMIEIEMQLEHNPIRLANNPRYQYLKSERLDKPIFSSRSVFIWCFEGLEKYRITKDIKYLHFHLCVFSEHSINMRRFNRISAILKTQYGSDITINSLMSINQIKYLFKEKTFVGISLLRNFDDIEKRVHKFYERGVRLEELKTLCEDHVAPFTGAVCILCTQADKDQKVSFCERFGYDHRVFSYFVDKQNDLFTTIWPKVDDFKKFIRDQQTDTKWCYAKTSSMALFRAQLLRSYFLKHEVPPAEVEQILDEIVKSFILFFSKLTPESSQVYQTIVDWIKANCSAHHLRSDQSWRNVLLIGGPGGQGKSTLAKSIHRGLGAHYHNFLFKPDAVGRQDPDVLSPIRFFDEVPTSGNEKSILYRFDHLEASATLLFTPNASHPSIEFLLAANASIIY